MGIKKKKTLLDHIQIDSLRLKETKVEENEIPCQIITSKIVNEGGKVYIIKTCTYQVGTYTYIPTYNYLRTYY